jgi:hypothetical protein
MSGPRAAEAPCAPRRVHGVAPIPTLAEALDTVTESNFTVDLDDWPCMHSTSTEIDGDALV